MSAVELQQGDLEAKETAPLTEGSGLIGFQILTVGGTATKVLAVIYAAASMTLVEHGAHAPLEITPGLSGILHQEVLEPSFLGEPGNPAELKSEGFLIPSEGQKVWLCVIPLDGTLILQDRGLGSFFPVPNWIETRGEHFTAAPGSVPKAFQSKESEEHEEPPPPPEPGNVVTTLT